MDALSPASFSLTGVSLRFLVRFVEVECKGRLSLKDLTTTQVKDRFILPMTADVQSSLCDKLKACPSTVEHVSDASWFISHAWMYKFLDVYDAIMSFYTYVDKTAESSGDISYSYNPKPEFPQFLDTVIWFDLFSNSQYNCSDKPFDWWRNTFLNAIKKMGKVLQIIMPWNDPLTLKRGWCVYELFATEFTESSFHVSMSEAEETNFLTSIRHSSGEFFKMLALVKSSNSQCFIKVDLERIHEAVKQLLPNGFTQLDSMVFRVMERWMISVLKYQIRKYSLVGDSLEEAAWKYSLAELYFDKSMFVEALPLYQAAYGTRKQMLGGLHADTLTTMYDYAWVNLKLDKNLEAEELFKECLEGRKQIYGSEDCSTLQSMNGLGELYRKIKRNVEAEVLYKSCLDGRMKVLGPDHADTLLSLNSLGNHFNSLGKIDEAEPLFKACLEGRRKSLGEDHVFSLFSMGNLAMVYKKQGKVTEAETLYKAALEGRRRTLGDDHPVTLNSMNILGNFYKGIGRHPEALQLYRSCLTGRERVLGRANPDTLVTLFSLATTYSDLEMFSDAVLMHSECHERRNSSLGPTHADTLASADAVEAIAKLKK